ncbi:hypothetical protein JB92DRAFT_3119488 [Gautieria morchelliformis]|nr:hypothetical protein JB92DRAFT_3119488 [Gautieria morchelliformis]
MSRALSHPAFISDPKGGGYIRVSSETATSPSVFSPSLGHVQDYGSTNSYRLIYLTDPATKKKTSYAFCTAILSAHGSTDFGKPGEGMDAYVFTVGVSKTSFNAMVNGLGLGIRFGHQDDTNCWFQVNVKKASAIRCTYTSKGVVKNIGVGGLFSFCKEPMSCEVLLNIKAATNKKDDLSSFSATLQVCAIIRKGAGPIPKIHAMDVPETTPTPVVQKTSDTTSDLAQRLDALSLQVSEAALFERKDDVDTAHLLRFLINTRCAVKKTNPTYSLALKILTNSLYGTLGFSGSRLYSPRCASSITGIGRWLITFAECVFHVLGLRVLGGDTDSCFVGPGRRLAKGCTPESRISDGLFVLGEVLRFTPFGRMSMETSKNETFKSLLLMKKKMYCGILVDGSLVCRGISSRRMDRLGMVRWSVETLIPVLLRTYKSKEEHLAMVASVVVESIVSN